MCPSFRLVSLFINELTPKRLNGFSWNVILGNLNEIYRLFQIMVKRGWQIRTLLTNGCAHSLVRISKLTRAEHCVCQSLKYLEFLQLKVKYTFYSQHINSLSLAFKRKGTNGPKFLCCAYPYPIDRSFQHVFQSVSWHASWITVDSTQVSVRFQYSLSSFHLTVSLPSAAFDITLYATCYTLSR